MRILNIMLGKGLGGIEQACIDHAVALRSMGHEVLMVVHPLARIIPKLVELGLPYELLPNKGWWDLSAPKRLGLIAQAFQADAAQAHGNRAITLAKRVKGRTWKLVAVAHNYQHQHLAGVDAVLAITQHMAQAIAGLPKAPPLIYVIPNMIQPDAQAGKVRRVWRQPPLIGTLGRFVEKKGFDVYIEALAILKTRGYDFRAVLGGSGEEEKALHKLMRKHRLEGYLDLCGWVGDPHQFMSSLDIFCLPSRHEPFGIVVLEAMAAKVPIVTTNSEGPSEIITHGMDGVVVAKGDAQALADGLAWMLDDESRARGYASEAYHTLKKRFVMERVSVLLDDALRQVVAGHVAPSPDMAEAVA